MNDNDVCVKQRMDGVTEYVEGYDVVLVEVRGKYLIRAKNEGGYNCTEVDLIELLRWIKANQPELLDAA